MTILITMKHAQLIKKELGLSLPHIKSSHRAEAMARGLGWKTNAALRAALMCGDADCRVSDDAFTSYLSRKGFGGIADCRLSAIVELVLSESEREHKLNGGGAGAASAEGSGASWFSIGEVTSNKWGTIAFGLFAVICYLLLTVQTADDYLDQAVEKSLDVSQTAATRSVLIMDKDLGHEVISGLLEYPYVTSAEIFDDHGGRVAFGRQDIRLESFAERLQGLMALDDEVQYQRILTLPPKLGERPGKLRITVHKAKAVAVLPGPPWGGMIFSLLLGIGALVTLIAGQVAFRGWMRLYLAEHYRLVHN